jgi:hypothetical protein
MRFKTLLLGSATAFAFAGGAAQAADLSVAEPVDYVRVCDAFGAGYWYIPGTDTCIRISGEVEFRTYFYDDDRRLGDDVDHTGSWQFRTQYDLEFTTKSMTDWGPLTTFIAIHGTSNTKTVTTDEYYLSLGPVLLGLTGSAFDIVGDGYAGDTNFGLDLSDDKADQVQLSWAMNGFGLVVALEQPSDRWGSSAESDIPDLVAAISASGTGWEAAVSFLYADIVNNDAQVAVQGNLEIDVWGDSLQLGALWADDGSGLNSGSSLATEDGWAVLVSYRHNWSSNLYSAVTVEWIDDNDANDALGAAFTTAFSPANDLWVGADIGYVDVDNVGDSWGLVLWAERKFGG